MKDMCNSLKLSGKISDLNYTFASNEMPVSGILNGFTLNVRYSRTAIQNKIFQTLIK